MPMARVGRAVAKAAPSATEARWTMAVAMVMPSRRGSVGTGSRRRGPSAGSCRRARDEDDAEAEEERCHVDLPMRPRRWTGDPVDPARVRARSKVSPTSPHRGVDLGGIRPVDRGRHCDPPQRVDPRIGGYSPCDAPTVPPRSRTSRIQASVGITA
jgi:hypothetical protein